MLTDHTLRSYLLLSFALPLTFVASACGDSGGEDGWVNSSGDTSASASADETSSGPTSSSSSSSSSSAGDTSAGDTSAGDTSADDTSADDTSADDTSADDTSADDTSADDTTNSTTGDGDSTGDGDEESSSSSSGDGDDTTSTTGDGDTSTSDSSSSDTTSTTGDGDGGPLMPSQDPPGGLDPSEVPVFVSLGWDDNSYSGLDASAGGMDWARQVFASRTNPDNSQAYASFYFTSIYIAAWQAEDPGLVKSAWQAALEDGNEIGVHTHSHLHGAMFTQSQWDDEIQTCIDWIKKPFNPSEPPGNPDNNAGIGATDADIQGFRTPFLEYNDATLTSVQDHGFRYDCSIEEGWQSEHSASNFNWPYTLDWGSPGHDLLVEWGLKDPISDHPGLWEMPAYPVVVPPDSEAAQYGIPAGLRDKCYGIANWFDLASGKITGFDYNLWVSFQMTKDEFVAVLKYSLDQRIAGNRAPMLFGTHTDYYSDKYTGAMASTPAQRREAIEEFLDYALTKPEVRVVSTAQVLDWMENPTPL